MKNQSSTVPFQLAFQVSNALFDSIDWTVSFLIDLIDQFIDHETTAPAFSKAGSWHTELLRSDLPRCPKDLPNEDLEYRFGRISFTT